MNAVFIRFMNMPLTIRAFTKEDEDGDYNIYLNGNLSDSAKKKSLEHEQKHITRGDFCSSHSAAFLEETMEE